MGRDRRPAPLKWFFSRNQKPETISELEIQNFIVLVISLENLTFRYPQQSIPALQDLTLSLAEPGVYLFSGPTGCGKSTLGLILAGAIPHIIHGSLSGVVLVAGREPASVPLRQTARQVGLLLQDVDNQMVTDRVEDEIAFGMENLAVPPRAMPGRLLAALRQVQAEHLSGRRLETLSAGERQRVMVAALLVLGQRVLILDEPLAYLDRPAAAGLLQLLARLGQEGITCLVLEHRRSLVLPLSRQEICLAQGRLAAGPPTPPALPPFRPTPASGLPAVRVTHVTFAWQPDSPCLEDISWEIEAGQSLVVLGNNGAGKTTLLKLLAGLRHPQSGTIAICGQTWRGRQARDLRRQVALVLQHPAQQLRLPTVAQELAWGAASPAAAAREIAALGLTGLEGRHPHSLSSGQKRRVTVAAALAREPRVLLLDEPTVGQDDGNLTILLQRLAAFVQAGGTLITATHDVRAASYLGHKVLLLCPPHSTFGGSALASAFFASPLGSQPV